MTATSSDFVIAAAFSNSIIISVVSLQTFATIFIIELLVQVLLNTADIDVEDGEDDHSGDDDCASCCVVLRILLVFVVYCPPGVPEVKAFEQRLRLLSQAFSGQPGFLSGCHRSRRSLTLACAAGVPEAYVPCCRRTTSSKRQFQPQQSLHNGSD